MRIICEHCGKEFYRNYGRFCSIRCAQRGKWGSFEKRYWSNVQRIDDVDSCWLWLGARSRKNQPYGRISLNKKLLCAHRVSYEFEYGSIPDGLMILHHCDNMQCVRPSHLYAGTAKDNARDMVQRNRQSIVQGEAHKNAKLTDELVRYCREQKKSGISYRKLGAMVGFNWATVMDAVTGRTWSHVK
jgi:hypothetical protein